MARREEIIRNFMEQSAKEEEERRSSRRGVAQRFLQQVQQKERESKPVVMKSVKADPLKIDVAKWEAPKYKKDSDEKALIKNTTKKHFLFKEYKESNKSSSNLSTGVASGTVAALMKAFEPVKVDKGKTIIQRGKLDQHLYVIENGTVSVQDGDETVATYGSGTTFGDQNLLHPVPSDKTVVATESTKVYRLHQETYRGIMKQRHLAEDAKKRQQEKERKEKQRQLMKAKKIVEEKEEEEEWWKDDEKAQLQIAIRNALQKVHQDDLERIRVLGEGQFGEVWLVAADLEVQRQAPKRYEFALKLQETYDEYREETARQEIRMMKQVSGYPFVSMLYRSYETEESKDMLLGLIPGGELWDTIHKEDEETGEWYSGLCEGHARFYAMVVADTLEYLHSESFVFRDLKPENIMIDGWGYPIIVDFGFCKRLPKGRSDKTFTFCGTPNYVSPEIILNVGHNGAADMWAFGCVVYEMISGMNPFFYDDIDNVELFRSICEDTGEVLNPKNHSRQVRKLIDGLLAKDPEKRMDAKSVLKDAWFEGVSLKRLRKRHIRAPWIPAGGEGEFAEYFDDSDDEAAALKKRERKIEEELKRRQQEEEERLRKLREEEELRKQQELEEQQRREHEERRLQLEEQLRLQELEAERLRKEEEDRKRQEQRRRKEQLRLQREREEEEKRLRLEEEERLREEEEERLRQEEGERLREEEEERLRLEEEERLREEEEERLRLEEEERLREEEEERLLLEEEKRLRKEEEERLREEEEERVRLEEEERLREEEEERLREEEEEERLRQEEEEERRREEEEEFRLQREREEEEERVRQQEEERVRQEGLRLKEEIEDLEEQARQKELDDQKERAKEVRRQQREVAEARERRRLKDQGLLEDDDSKQETRNYRGARKWNTNSPVNSQRKTRSIADLVSPVPKGLVSKLVTNSNKRSPTGVGVKSPGTLDVRSSVKRGIVAQRLSAAKAKGEKGNVPSLFSSW